MMRIADIHTGIQFALAGVLLGIGHFDQRLWWLVIPGIAYFIALAVQPGVLYVRLFLYGWMAFTIKSAVAIAFYFTTYPLQALPITVEQFQLPLITFYWATVSLFLGLGGGCAAIGLAAVHRSAKRYVFYMVAPGIWLLSDAILAPLFFALCTYGPGASINANYTLGVSGYLLGEHSLLFLLAQIGGLYALTLAAAVLAVCVYHVTCRGTTLHQSVLVVGMLALVLTTTSFETAAHMANGNTTVAIIDTDFSAAERREITNSEDRSEALIEAVTTALSLEPDYLLLPEDARFLDHSLSPTQSQFLFEFLYGQTDTIILDTGRVEIGADAILAAVVLDGANDASYAVDKQYLVPQGEFMPYVYALILRSLGRGAVVDRIIEDMDYVPGNRRVQAELPDHVPGILFCFSEVAPLAAVQLRRERDMPFIAHPVSHSWFHTPQQYWRQRDMMLRVQAAFAGVPIVSVGNQVSGALYTPTGLRIAPEVVATGERWQIGLFDL